MKQIKVYITAEQWAEKRLHLLIDWNNDATDFELDSFIERCGFCLLEEVEPETKPEQPQPSEIPTDKVEAVKYFLNQLPEGYRERALAQISERHIKRLDIAVDIKSAISSFEDWSTTREQGTFWWNVFLHYEDPTSHPLPPLPND